MTVSTGVAYVASMVLEATILFRCVRNGTIRQYPFFWAYLCCVFVGDLAMYPAGKLLSPSAFSACYWAREFICVLAGYALVMEIIEKAFAHFEGPKRLGRNAALVTLVAIVCITGLQAISEHVSYTVWSTTEVEANLRGAELILLSIVILVISYYDVLVGRNLKGITIGYGFCTAAVAVNEALRTFMGRSYQTAFSDIWSYSYVVSLIIWAVTLWSYAPNPAPAGRTQMDGDYAALASRTKATLAGMRAYFRKAVRP
jgi:hypothetical protein